MKTINLTVTGQVVQFDTQVLHVEGTAGLYNLTTSYDEDWDDVTRKVVIFIAEYKRKKCGKTATIKIAIEDTGEPIAIPPEVLAQPGRLTIGAIGYNDDGTLKITTADYGNENFIEITKAISDSSAVSPSAYTPDIWTTILNEIGNLNNLKTQNKTNLVAAINEIFDNGGGGAVQSVNGKTGKVVLNATDVGAATPASVSRAVNAEATAREAADAELTQGIATVANGLATEATARQDADTEINSKIPAQASPSNQLADRAFVNSSVQTATANFRGNWDTYAQIPTDGSLYPADYAGSTIPTTNDYLVVQDASDTPVGTGEDPLEGTWRFKYSGEWATDGKSGWHPEYQVNETPLTSDQLAALNSGITTAAVAQIGTNAGDISDLQTDVASKQDTLAAGANITIDSATNTISATDTTYSDFVGTDGTTAGIAGLVPAPATTDDGKFLKADGTWDDAGSGILYATIGANEDGAMTQKAATEMIWSNASTLKDIRIGRNNTVGSTGTTDSVFIGNNIKGSGKDGVVIGGCVVAGGFTLGASNVHVGLISSTSSRGNASTSLGNTTETTSYSVAIGNTAKATGSGSVVLGAQATATGSYGGAIGRNSTNSRASEISIGDGSANANYGTRYLANVRDPQLAQDAATKNYVDNANEIILENPFTAQTGWEFLYPAIHRQGNHYFGSIVVHKTSGDFTGGDETVATISAIPTTIQCFNGFSSPDQWPATFTAAHAFITTSSSAVGNLPALIVRGPSTDSYMRLQIDFVATTS